MKSYDHHLVDQLWQQRWQEGRLDEADADPRRPKYYCLEMLPYPSGRIHMGHVRNYSIGDVVARQQRMRGKNVLHPIGWDSFGLPAENAAIDHGAQPMAWTEENIERMRKQFRRLGFSYAWEREVAAHRPEYYRWNQWLFLQMLERDLAYRSRRAVNWCDHCATVLANEQAESGACWRCGTVVNLREMDGWFLRITRYADELQSALDTMEGWPERVRTMQRNWIGRSEGADVRFCVADSDVEIPIFTTRVDTIFGCTFIVMAPEHPELRNLVGDTRQAREVLDYCEVHSHRTTAERTQETAEKTGVFTGRHAINPYNGERVPIWVANFVVAEYGSGALMAVPAHDTRDHEFARRYGLPIVQVVQPAGVSCDVQQEAFVGEGILVHSGEFTGERTEKAREKMARHATENGFGGGKVQYRLRDWGISRQRYWGTPIPIIHCEGCGAVPVPVEDLPVILPLDIEITGKGGSPLAADESFVRVSCPRCQGPARRETDTMDTFVDSGWYYYRYCDPGNTELPVGEEGNYWFPVDLYIGGIEHANLHLIYTRFFARVMQELGLVDVREPVTRHLSQGMVVDWSYRCPEHGYLAADKRAGGWRDDPAAASCGVCGRAVEVKKEKMSKSKFNTVDPDYLLDRYGADATRLFAVFAAPPEKAMDWSDTGIEGCHRFLQRVWRLVDRLSGADNVAEPAADDLSAEARALRRKTHDTIRRVTTDIEERLHLNTAVAAIMELVNELQSAIADGGGRQEQGGLSYAVQEGLETLLLLLCPFAPHLASEAWERLGKPGSLVQQVWPRCREEFLARETVTVVVQVNGKLRGSMELAPEASEDEVLAGARAHEGVAAHLEGKTVRRVVHVPGKLINLVVS